MACACRAIRDDNMQWRGTGIGCIGGIQNPAGNAGTFTFNQSWLDIAEPDSKEEHRKD